MHDKNDSNSISSLNNNSIITRIAGSSIVSVKPIFSFDSKYLITVGGSTIKIISTSTGECIQELRSHKHPITSIKINATNQFQLYSVSNDKTIIKWDFNDNFPLKTFKVKVSVLALYTIPDDSDNLLFLVSNKSQGNELLKYNMKTGNYTKMMEKCSNEEKSVTIGVGGLYYACINKKNLTFFNTITKKTYSHSMKSDPNVAPFNCIISHPNDICVATGSDKGKIYLWYNFLENDEMPKKTLKHWHNLSVGDICFSPEGSVLFSGGKECVFVKWPISSGKESKDTFPRLGSPLQHIVCSPDASLYAICHTDNSIRMVTSNFHVRHIFQGLVRCFVDKRSFKRPSLLLDPRTKSLVTTGTPGHLQFYDIALDKQRFNLDIVGKNYISPITIKKPLDLMDIELYAFNNKGNWMATYERRDDGLTTSENKLKFWFYNDTNHSYELNTQVELPHRRKMNDLKFRPKVKVDGDEMLVTSSNDGDFKTWILTEDNDIYRDNECWRCINKKNYQSSTHHDDYFDVGCDTNESSVKGAMRAGAVAFSGDGSVISIVFHSSIGDNDRNDVVTIWEPITGTLKCVIDNPCREKIYNVLFGRGKQINLILVHGANHLCVWDLFTQSLCWYKQEKAVKVISDPKSDFIAVFTSNNDLKIITLECEEVLYFFDRVSQSAIESALFVVREDPLPLPTFNRRGKPHNRTRKVNNNDIQNGDKSKTEGNRLKSPKKNTNLGRKSISNGDVEMNDIEMETNDSDKYNNTYDDKIPRIKDNRNKLDWQNQSKLYFINGNQELLTLDFSINEIRRIIEMQPLNFNKENDDSLFAQLLSKDNITLDTNMKNSLISTRASNQSVLLKKIIESSPATLPPMNLMLKDLIDSFFTCDKCETKDESDEEISDNEMQVDDDSGSDFEVPDEITKSPEKKKELLSNEEDLDLPLLKFLNSIVEKSQIC